MTICKEHFLKMMRFPNKWSEWDMYPDELYIIQVTDYEPGTEEGSEHYRYGAFQWWLRQELKLDIIQKYFKLTELDPDKLMGEEARNDLNRQIILLNLPI